MVYLAKEIPQRENRQEISGWFLFTHAKLEFLSFLDYSSLLFCFQTFKSRWDRIAFNPIVRAFEPNPDDWSLEFLELVLQRLVSSPNVEKPVDWFVKADTFKDSASLPDVFPGMFRYPPLCL